MEQQSKLKVKSTGTTIISCPFDKGVIVATDTRATDTRAFTPFYTPRKTDSYMSVENEVQFHVSGAGFSNVTSLIASSFFQMMVQFNQSYNIKMSAMDSPLIFMDYFNELCSRHFLKRLSPLELEVLFNSVMILTVKTPKFIFSFETTFDGGSCFFQGRNGQTFTSLGAIGSGSRYILGNALVQDSLRPFEKKSLEEVRQWIIDHFKQSTKRDIGSSTSKGLHLTIVHKERSPAYQSL